MRRGLISAHNGFSITPSYFIMSQIARLYGLVPLPVAYICFTYLHIYTYLIIYIYIREKIVQALNVNRVEIKKTATVTMLHIFNIHAIITWKVRKCSDNKMFRKPA